MKFSNLSRIYITCELVENQTLTLDGDNFHYCKSVLRMKISEKFRIFNQLNGEFIAKITVINKRNLQVLIEKKLRDVVLAKPLIMAISIIKADKFTIAIKGATALGVTEIIPIVCDRTQFKTINHIKFNKSVIQATEQSERFAPPVLHYSLSLEKFFHHHSDIEQIIFANEEENLSKTINSIENFKNNLAILIGPEGGFSAREKQKLLANSKVVSASLGSGVLRSEIAAINTISCINLIRSR